MKLILETQELEAIVKENIAAKYPKQDAAVSIQNKRNGIEVTVVLTEKLAEKEAEDCVDDKDYIDDEYYVDEEPTEVIAENIEA
mgnify:CR=1 FL=1